MCIYLLNFTLTGYKGMLSAFMGFIEPGDEVIIFEPFFDQYGILSCEEIDPLIH
jgi:hypothetical protein